MRRAGIHASPVLWGLVLGAALGAAVLAACASRQPVLSAGEVEERKKAIQGYWNEIEDWRATLKLPVARPSIGGSTPGAVDSPPKVRCQRTRRPATEACEDTCTVADHICENMESICRISGQLEGDSWAENKCRGARTACDQARQSCCECAQSDQTEKSSAAPAPRPVKRPAR
jgi:hypothetical protein